MFAPGNGNGKQLSETNPVMSDFDKYTREITECNKEIVELTQKIDDITPELKRRLARAIAAQKAATSTGP